MAVSPERTKAESAEAVAAYKRLILSVLERRPSGTRQRLAAALAKNRSFISQITNPAYSTPVPANHLEIIFEICHFSTPEKRQFMEAYGKAHSKYLAPSHNGKLIAHTIYLPDLGDDSANNRLRTLVTDFVRQVAGLSQRESVKGKRK